LVPRANTRVDVHEGVFRPNATESVAQKRGANSSTAVRLDHKERVDEQQQRFASFKHEPTKTEYANWHVSIERYDCWRRPAISEENPSCLFKGLVSLASPPLVPEPLGNCVDMMLHLDERKDLHGTSSLMSAYDYHVKLRAHRT